ncbi:type II toxin-antitoxin system MqsR family toxin [Methylobacter svalbardensis]|uniref:type II toxin-antitoxin system MqsR family toxin n=1 Tax=Methylobacter svalbardensis TaxID=3080016 RepID=UPI0030EB9F59
MVSIKESYQPSYSLDVIRQSAQKGDFRYDGRQVDRDIRNLGYTGDDVKSCIANIITNQFQKSIQYENATYDVYISDYQKHDDAPIDKIYMKLRLLPNGELQIAGIGSFHLKRL